MTLAERFFAFDDELARHGVKPCSEWWRVGLRRWFASYEEGGALELWACAGRGSAKSDKLYKLALFFALFGGFVVPPGERHFAIVLSRLREEAAKGLVIIDRWLTLLGIKHKLADDAILLADLPVGIRVVAASVGGASGWRAFFIGCDEYSKLATGGAEQLDAGEVRSSAVAMTATHPRAPIVTVGSAWAAFGEFYDAITSGTDGAKVVLGPAPTWVAAPHITRAQCEAKEPDARRFAREYACEFQGSATAAFDAGAVDRAFAVRDASKYEKGRRVLVIDPSSGRRDSFTAGVFGWNRLSALASRWVRTSRDEYFLFADGSRMPNPNYVEPTEPHYYLACDEVWSAEGRFWDQTSAGDLWLQIAQMATRHGTRVILSDQREAFANRELARQHGLSFTEVTWTSASKPPAVEEVRRWLREGLLGLPEHATMKREFKNYEEKLLPTGTITFGARGKGHDDLVALTVTLAMAFIGEEPCAIKDMSPIPGAMPRREVVNRPLLPFG